jgi:hypothetical protein
VQRIFRGVFEGFLVAKSAAQKAKEAAREAAVLVLGESNPDGIVETDPDAQDPDELRALAELNAGSDVKWAIHRVSDMGGKRPGYCGALTTAELTLDRVATEWGIGKYKIRGSRSNGQFAGQSTITIAEAPKDGSLKPAAAQVDSRSSLQDYIALMEAKDAARSASMREWALILSPILAPIAANLFGSKGPTLAELTQTLMNMKTLNGGSESQLTKIEELAKLVEVVQGIGGDGGKSGWADIVRDGIKTVGDVLPALAARIPGFMPSPAALASPANAPRGTLSAPNGASTPKPPAGSPAEATPMLQLLGWLKEQLAALSHQASLNKDPQLYADVVLDNLPQVDPKMLRDMLGKPDWWATLCQFSPNVQPYPQWFAECRDALIRGLDDMIGATSSPAAPMPHDTDTTDE